MAVALTAITWLAPPPPAWAAQAPGAYQQVLHTYQLTGAIPPCRFTAAQLASALQGVDTYGAQYFQDFTDAIQGALAARAAGQCAGLGAAASRGGGTPNPGTGSVTGEAPAQIPGSSTPATRSGIPLPLLLLAVVCGLSGLAILLGLLGASRGWRPRWWAAWGHAWREAGFRAGGLLAEFRDWRRWS